MMKRMGVSMKLVCCFVFALVPLTTVSADEFYQGKIIYFVVGTPPGGGYDLYTRAFARHMGKYIPGNPTIVVQNKPGAGMLVAANYIYNRAKPDGLTVGIWNSALILQQALGGRGIQFDGTKYEWIGAPAKGSATCAIMGFTGLSTMKDIIASQKTIKMGGIRAGNTTDDMPKVLNRTAGTRFDVVRGFRNPLHVLLAMRKGEVDGICFTWESMRTAARAMLDAEGDDKMIPFVTYGKPSDDEIAKVPQITEFVTDKARREVVAAWGGPFKFQRPFMLPPGTPETRVNILREAFRSAIEDPELKKEAARARMTLAYISGDEVEKFVAGILNMPASAKKELQFLVRRP